MKVKGNNLGTAITEKPIFSEANKDRAATASYSRCPMVQQQSQNEANGPRCANVRGLTDLDQGDDGYS